MATKDALLNEYKKIIADVKTKLNNNSEWRKRYSDVTEILEEQPEARERHSNRIKSYHALIANNEPHIVGLRKKFRALEPIFVYLSVNTVMKVSAVKATFDLRYEGQSIAELIVEEKESNDSAKDKEYRICLKIGEKMANTNKRDFGFSREDASVLCGRFDWSDEDAKKFRKYFSNKPPRASTATKESREHKFESEILTDMLKVSSLGKKLLNVQPVLLCGARFQMPTPINASKVKVGRIEYSRQYGGGIDIMAHAGNGGNEKLCVIEVKDANTSSEPPQVAMKQAIAYATFIRELLRSTNGEAWWKLFGFQSALPEKLTIYTAVAMPKGKKDEIYPREIIDVNENDKFVLHYIYIDGNTGQPLSATFP